MTKTNEFRIKEIHSCLFLVQRKYEEGKQIDWITFFNQSEKPAKTIAKSTMFFDEIKDAKKFIDKILENEKPIPVEIEDCIYHTYP